jgi:alpha-1,6-mannosyltransferase
MHEVRSTSGVLEKVTADAARSFARLALCAAATVGLTLATPFVFRSGGDNAFMVMAIAAGFVAVAASRIVEHAPPAKAWWLIVGVAVLLRAVLLFTEPLLSSDIYRYVWDGKVQAAGINPYRYVPADAALASLRDAAIYPNINRIDSAVTIYPPVAQMFFFLVTRLGESVTTMKLALLACEGVTATVIVTLLRRTGQPTTRFVAYAWHPLPIWEIANNGHVDALMTALMMLGIWFALCGRLLRGAISVTLGALVKPLAVFALPAIWRPWDWKMPLFVALVIVLCYAPYLSVGGGVFGYLAGYLMEEGFDSGRNIWLLAVWRQIAGTFPGDTIVYYALAGLAFAALALHTAFRNDRLPETTLSAITRLGLAGLFLLSPNFPWYFLALTPFVALVGGAPVWTFTLGALLLQEEVDWDPYVPLLIRKSALYGAFLGACAYAGWQAWRRTATGTASTHEVRHAR